MVLRRVAVLGGVLLGLWKEGVGVTGSGPRGGALARAAAGVQVRVGSQMLTRTLSATSTCDSLSKSLPSCFNVPIGQICTHFPTQGFADSRWFCEHHYPSMAKALRMGGDCEMLWDMRSPLETGGPGPPPRNGPKRLFPTPALDSTS